ncbi:LysR family transcriptional regulator [Agarivorans sp. MS3-6]|uniref:LysR family transcriptional regulator n=1 Tax=Agarivorans sp. TSD2052 TaxID=2937286 RepID=UPI00200F9101|nr:LysR family transcriptional regulator [Agarivorans sp. TSD2052]UPW17061.1 LysR family transcriptional regulator [Agarivorans sp. TSD2052]
MLNLEQLSAFIAAAEKGSFSAAARHTGKSQSSVSIAVNNLELDLGITLFDRSSKYPSLTHQGERLYEQAKVLMRQAERLQSYAQAAVNEVEDIVKIAIDPIVPLTVIDIALEKMSRKFPHTQVQLLKLSGQHLNDAVLNEEVQLGVHLASKAVPDNLDFVSIAQIEWVCVCSPDSALADMQEVDNETLIAQRQIVCSSMLENAALKNSGKVSQDTWQAFDQDDLVRLVEQGLGWAFLPKQMAVEKQASGTLIEFAPEFQRTAMYYPADLVWKANLKQGPVMRFLIELLPQLC